jgi:hypothetical protein
MGEDLAAFKKRIREQIFFMGVEDGTIELVDTMFDYPDVPEFCPQSTQDAFMAA